MSRIPATQPRPVLNRLVLAAGILLMPIVLASPLAAQTSQCGERLSGQIPNQDLEARLKLKLSADQAAPTMEFGRGRDVQRMELVPEITGSPGPGVVESPVFIRVGILTGDGGKQIPPNQIVVERAEVSNNGDLLFIQLCVDPAGVDAGLYQGSIKVDDPRFTPLDVPIVVSLQFQTWLIPAFVGLLFAGVAAAAAVLSTSLQDGKLTRELIKKNWGWLVIAATLGAFVGVVVFVNTFEEERSWEGDFGAWLALALAAVTAGYTMSILPTLGRALKNPRDEKRKKETEEGEEGEEGKKAPDHDTARSEKVEQGTDDHNLGPTIVIDETDAATTDAPKAADTGAAD